MAHRLMRDATVCTFHWDYQGSKYNGIVAQKADDIVKNSKLRVADVREVYNETVPKGYIISQLPFAGSEVREGRRLYITVSRGIEKITVPYVIGKLERVAWIDIMRLGFNIGNIEYVERDDKPDGVVLAQYPHYGVNLPYGATINLIVSQAPPEAEISLLKATSHYKRQGTLLRRIV